MPSADALTAMQHTEMSKTAGRQAAMGKNSISAAPAVCIFSASARVARNPRSHSPLAVLLMFTE